MATERYQIGSLRLNAGTQEVTRDGQPVPLPPLSFALLLTLTRHAPNVVTTEQLEAEVWSGLVIDRGTINKRVVLVRNALRKAGCDRDYIAVVRGTGYRLAVPVKRIDAEPPPSAEPSARETPGDQRLVAGNPWRFAALAVLTVMLAAVLVRWGLQGPERETAEGRSLAPDPTAAGISQATGLAVLPFVTEGEDEVDRVFAEGIARDITRMLDERTVLDVASSASSSALVAEGLTEAEIAERLGVEMLLRGSVRSEDDRMTVLAELVHAPSGRTLWADSFGSPRADVFILQTDLANRVATVLRADMNGNAPMTKLVAATSDMQAYTSYLEGRKRLDERLERGGEAIREALVSFEAATELDPAFVRAHVGLAAASFLMPSYDPESDSSQWLQRAEASARFALDLDPSSTEAMGVLAAVVSSQGDPLRAAGLFERAIGLGGRDPDVLHWHAMLATSMGYFESLVPMLEDAYRLDPLNPLLGCSLAGSLNFSGRPEQALMVLEGMRKFSRRDLAMAVASLYLGDWERARDLLRGIRLRTGTLPDTYADLLVEAFSNPLRRATVEASFIEAVESGALHPLVAFEALLVMGSPRAFDLEADLGGSWFEHRLPEAVWHNWGVELRRDPRFKQWVRALGYDQHWRKYGWPDRCRPTGLNDFECV
jgi:TolB-like protein/DNA-binding winged helix-turn-helix (wHTH) protein